MQVTTPPHPPLENAAFLSDVIAGLSATPKTLPCQYFYDVTGSELFEKITQLPEYYPTRTEISILSTHAEEIAQALGADVLLVEYGAGASVKTRLLLDAMPDLRAYIPIDVSRTFLLQTAAGLRDDYPNLTVLPVAGNFMRYDLPTDLPEGRKVGFFPGSTIGNLNDADIHALLTTAAEALGDNAAFLIGVDLEKSDDILLPAYDDAAGVTAQFNLNILRRINRELGADFDVSQFTHEARWNRDASRIEMHLVSRIDQTVRIDDRALNFAAGESIHTENSRKFNVQTLSALFEEAGWNIKNIWEDRQRYFAVMLLSLH